MKDAILTQHLSVRTRDAARIAAHYANMAFGMRNDGFDEDAVAAIERKTLAFADEVHRLLGGR